MTRLVILTPPPLKPSEPGLAADVVARILRAHGLDAQAIDASLGWHYHTWGRERLQSSLDQMARAGASARELLAYRRAVRSIGEHPHALQRLSTYNNREIYTSAIGHLDNIFRLAGASYADFHLRLAEVEHGQLRRERSQDMARLAHLRGPFDDYFTDELLPTLKQIKPSHIGFSLTFSSQIAATFRWAVLLREHFPEAQLLLGGALVACWAALAAPLESEPFKLFDRIFPTGDAQELASLAGDLGGHSLPDAALLNQPLAADFSALAHAGYLVPLPTIPIALGRGCYWRRCTFCPDHLHPRHHPCCNAAIETWLQAVAERFPAGAMLHLCDSSLAPAQLEHLAGFIAGQRLPISWHGFTRLEPRLADPGFALHLAQGGCVMLQLGIESASPRLLELMGKGVSPELARRTLRNLHAAGIRNQIYLLFGLPSETEAERDATLKFVEEEAATLHDINHAILNLPKLSPMHKYPERFGISEIRPFQDDTDLSLYDDFRSGDSHPRVEARRWLQGRFLKSPAVRRVLGRLRSPFKANHLCFLAPPK